MKNNGPTNLSIDCKVAMNGYIDEQVVNQIVHNVKLEIIVQVPFIMLHVF